MAESYKVNYEDERFGQVEAEKQAALTENEQLYGGMLQESEKFYQDQVDASKQWAEKQTEIQNQQTDFALEKIEQQKQQAEKDYKKEQSAAYVDYQKQSNPYGAQAEQMAGSGMAHSGYSESARVAMYTAYQNRVAAARESQQVIIQNFDNAMTEARLQNSAELAEIALAAMQQQLELNLQGFQHRNQLLLEQANKKLQIDELYQNRWQNVLAQINQENALAEQIRQYNESMAENKRQFDTQMAQSKQQYVYRQTQDDDGDLGDDIAIDKFTGGIGDILGTVAGGITGAVKKAQIVQELNAYIANGASKSEISKYIRLAESDGMITAAQAKELRSTYVAKGTTY